MRSAVAATGSVAFFLAAPGTVVGLVPWLITGWRVEQPLGVLVGVGAVLVAAGVGVLLHAFTRFVVALGTPAPVAPTERLVVDGVYRYVRNPMYLAVITALAGEVLIFWSLALLLYAIVAAAAMVAFVRLYEEPALAQRFGAGYLVYRRAVPGWWPRLRPWRP